jgi:hypothetical protein
MEILIFFQKMEKEKDFIGCFLVAKLWTKIKVICYIARLYVKPQQVAKNIDWRANPYIFLLPTRAMYTKLVIFFLIIKNYRTFFLQKISEFAIFHKRCKILHPKI